MSLPIRTIVRPMWVWALHFITARLGRVIPIIILMTHTTALIITTPMAIITDMVITAMAIIAMGIIAPAIAIRGIRGGIGALPSLSCRNLGFTVAGIRGCIGKRAAV